MTPSITDSEAITIRVLHVDDEPDLADMAASFLEREDDRITVYTATNAEDGLEMLATDDIDCIISDYDMPSQDGIEFLGAVREEYPDLPFILYTGKGSEEVASEAISSGVTDYLQKDSGTDQYTLLANRVTNAVAQTRAQREVTRMREYFGTILEHASDFVMVVDRNLQVEYISPAVERVLGYTPDELEGIDAFEPIHPEDLPVASEALADVLEQPDQEHTIEYRARHADGSWRWLEVRGRNRIDDPVIEGIIVSVRDITDRKASGQELQREHDRFRAVFHEAFDAMVIFDDDRQFTDVNPSACELFGQSKDDLIGATIGEVLPAEFDLAAAWEEFKAADQIRGEVPIQRPTGETRITEYAATADIVSGEHLNILRDVTEREEYIDQIEGQNDELEQFASIVSHDLRNPLNIAQGRVELAQQECESEHLADAVAAIERSFTLIDDILTLAQEGEQISEVELVDLAEVIDTCWQTVETKEATLTIETEQTVEADRSRLQQLVENLIRNAIEHGGDDVAVAIGDLADGFYVGDDGPGISKDDREQVFESGYSTETNGIGYGLQIVKEIADAHDWKIRVTESDEDGARFEISGVEFAGE